MAGFDLLPSADVRTPRTVTKEAFCRLDRRSSSGLCHATVSKAMQHLYSTMQ